VVLAELVIDWSVYSVFLAILMGDLTACRQEGALLDHTHRVSRRLGLVSMPLVCVVLRMGWKILKDAGVGSTSPTLHQCLWVIVVFLCLVCAKVGESPGRKEFVNVS
jgi:hypothetical protein